MWVCAKLPLPTSFSSSSSFYFGPTLASLPLLLKVFSPSPFFTPPSSSSFFHSPRPPDSSLEIFFFVVHENYCDLVIFWVMQPRPRIRFPAAGRRFTHNLRTKCLGARETNALSLQLPLGKKIDITAFISDIIGTMQ